MVGVRLPGVRIHATSHTMDAGRERRPTDLDHAEKPDDADKTGRT